MIKNLWRWHPKVALRYLPIVNRIKNSGISNPSVLEIGSGSLGIAPYLGKPIVGVDQDFSGPQTDLLTKVRGSALKLPLNDQSFDVVLLVDVLEHICPSDRAKAIEEAIRVTKHLLILAAPCGKKSQQEDKFLAKYYEKIYKKQFPFYREHLKYYLPQCSWINDTIKQIAKNQQKKIEIDIEGNVNLSLHRFLMKGWMTNSMVVDFIFRKVFLILIPIFLRFNQKPTYRKIFYLEFKQ